MKTKILFLIFIISCNYISVNAQFAWEWQNPKPQGNTLKDVFFTDSLTGYAVGVAGTVIKTTDGGNNWDRMYCGVWDALNSVHFTDAYTGYIAGERGRILKTTDAGQHWDSLITNTVRTLYSIIFVNSNTGYAAGDSGTILKTTNGGTTWNTLASGTLNRLLSLSFIDENNGMATGNNGTALKTTDGGATWQPLATGTTTVLNAVHMLDNNHIYICGNAGLFLKSMDGGTSFTDSTLTTTNNYDIKFINADTGFIAGKNFLRTTDGGSTWSSYSLSKEALSLSIPVSNYNKIYTVGYDGSIFVSDNQGASFSSKLTNLQTDYSYIDDYVDLFFTDANTGYIVCRPATDILKTTDGGVTWYSRPGGGLPNASYPYALHFPSKDTGYYCGFDTWNQVGIIYKTVNQGNTWINLFDSSPWGGIGLVALRSIFFINSNIGITVGNSGVIYKTIDGGQNWASITSGISNTLNKIFFATDSIGYIAGSGGKILKTTDGGDHWTPLTSGTTSDIPSIYFINKDTGFVGTNNMILKTTDGGNSWVSVLLNFTPTSIHFSGTDYGYATGGNKIIKTTDGGNTWNYMHSETANSIYRIFFTDSLTGYILGSNRTILKTVTGGMVNTNPVFLPNSYVKIYPNPSAGSITIDNNDDATIRLFDMSGKLVLTKQLYSGENQVDISLLNNGMYIAKVISPKNIRTTKIIKN